MRARGYTLVEMLTTVAILGLLLFAVGAALTHVLDAEALGAGRQSALRSADELGTRMSEEARSATAVFVPSVDVLGQPNTDGHEVDFFRKSSDGTLNYVAYRFDAATATVRRYEYVPAAGGAQILNNDLMAENIQSLAAVRTTPGAIASVVGNENVAPVNVYYGTPELEGGNGIVAVSMQAGLPGQPPHPYEVHLSSHAAPTDLSIVVQAGSPPPSPGTTPTPIAVSFVLQSVKVRPPHGPNGKGSPGDGGGGPHGPGIDGTATFLGAGAESGVSWFDFYNVFPTVADGIYYYTASDGSQVTVDITCSSGACPPFKPLPVATSSAQIIFHTIN